MGMFDSVWVPCPKCGERHEFQSKAGDCGCHSYTLETAPQIVLFDISGEQRVYCDKCDSVFLLNIDFGKPRTEVKTIDDAETLADGRKQKAEEISEVLRRNSIVSGGRRFLQIQQPVRADGGRLVFIQTSGDWRDEKKEEVVISIQEYEQKARKCWGHLGLIAQEAKLVNDAGPYYLEIPL